MVVAGFDLANLFSQCPAVVPLAAAFCGSFGFPAAKGGAAAGPDATATSQRRRNARLLDRDRVVVTATSDDERWIPTLGVVEERPGGGAYLVVEGERPPAVGVVVRLSPLQDPEGDAALLEVRDRQTRDGFTYFGCRFVETAPRPAARQTGIRLVGSPRRTVGASHGVRRAAG